MVAGPFPNDGLRFPKTAEKPPFMTREEIERQIARGGLSDAEIGDLWDSLYLQVEEISECLKHVKEQTTQPFLYPMICFAAYTGARRSEIIRVRLSDLDLIGKFVTIHEKKRVKGKITTRRVPLSSFLITTLQEWFAVHPGGQFLFTQQSTTQQEAFARVFG